MKSKFLLAGVLVAISGAAFAADLPRKAPAAYVPAAVSSYYNWSGWYVGGHAGYAWGNPVFTNVANTSTFGGAIPGQAFNEKSRGFIGGGQVGYNWQFGQWVTGLEASYSGSNVKGTRTAFVDDTFTNQLRGLLLVTGRAGYAVNNTLFYAKGGYAGANRRATVVDTGLVSPGVGSGNGTAWHNGWTVGTGVEYGLTPNWILGLEYDYVRLGARNYQLDGTDPGGLSYLYAIKADYHLLTGRVSYKF